MENGYWDQIKKAVSCRKNQFPMELSDAFRLFNGFLEGFPHLLIELFGSTLLIYDYSSPATVDSIMINKVIDLCQEEFPQIKSVILKRRNSINEDEKRGILACGDSATTTIHENNVKFAVDLSLNQDASFYFDTRNLRVWLKNEMAGANVLNTFAYTGSLGAAARAANAQRVIQTDINAGYLNIARRTFQLNGFQVQNKDFLVGDFFHIVANIKRQGILFDCVIIDPPFFAESKGGTVDLLSGSLRLINKVRPLVRHGGYLVVVNNAIFLSGADFYRLINEICQSEYISLEKIIPIPEDVTGYPTSISQAAPLDPAPFNHSTKIVLLKVKRKDQA